MLLAAAVVVVVALLAGAAWLARGDDGDELKTVDRPAPLLLFPDHVPNGLAFLGKTELGSGRRPLFIGPADVYADEAGEEVLVTWTGDAPEGELTTPEGDEVDVGGLPGVSSTFGDYRGITWRLPNGRIITVSARGEMAVDLLAIARRTSVEGTHAVVPDDVLADGVARLGTVPFDRLSLMAVFAEMVDTGEGRSLAWQDPKDAGPLLVVLVQEATPVDELVLGLFDQEVEHRDVDGHDAVVARTNQNGFDARSVAWVEDWHLVRVVSTGLPLEQTIAVAESLREVSRSEYDQLTGRPDVPEGEDLIAEGGTDASPWRVYLDADRSLCIDRPGSGSCAGPTSVGMFTVDKDDTPTLVVGSAPLDTTVDVVDGSSSLLAAEPVELEGQVFFTAVVPDGVTSVEVRITDTDGNVDRRTVRTDRSGSSGSGAPTTTAG